MQVTSGDTFHSGGKPPVLNPAFHPELHDVFIYRVAVLRNHVLHYETKQPLTWQQIADLASDSYSPLYTHNQRLQADEVMAAYTEYLAVQVRRIPGLTLAVAASVFMSLFTEEAKMHEVEFYNRHEGARIARFDTPEMSATLREWHPHQALLAALETQYHKELAMERERGEHQQEAREEKLSSPLAASLPNSRISRSDSPFGLLPNLPPLRTT